MAFSLYTTSENFRHAYSRYHHDGAAAGTEHFGACNGVRGMPEESRHCWKVLELYIGGAQRKSLLPQQVQRCLLTGL